MLSILGIVIKVLGLILLCAAVLFLFFVLSVLFIPVQYHALGYYRQEYMAKINISWLLHIFSARCKVKSNEDFIFEIRFLGLCVWNNHKRKKSKREKRKKEKTYHADGADNQIENMKQSKDICDTDSSDMYEVENTVNTLAETAKKEAEIEKTGLEEKGMEEPATEEKTVTENKDLQSKHTKKKKKTSLKKIDDIRYSFSRFYDKITDIKNHISRYIDILKSDAFRNSFEKCKIRLYKILHNIWPKKWKINIRFAKSEQPDLVGQVMGIWGMLYPVHRGKIQLETSFEEDFFDVDFFVKGQVWTCVFVKTLLICLFDKDIKELRRCFSQEEG